MFHRRQYYTKRQAIGIHAVDFEPSIRTKRANAVTVRKSSAGPATEIEVGLKTRDPTLALRFTRDQSCPPQHGVTISYSYSQCTDYMAGDNTRHRRVYFFTEVCTRWPDPYEDSKPPQVKQLTPETTYMHSLFCAMGTAVRTNLLAPHCVLAHPCTVHTSGMICVRTRQ